MARLNEPQHSIEIALNEAEDANGGAYVLLSKMAEVAADAVPDGWYKLDGEWHFITDDTVDPRELLADYERRKNADPEEGYLSPDERLKRFGRP